MTFTYSISTDAGLVRITVGDTVEGSGPRPSDGNYTDEEIAALITEAGSWQGAVGMIYDALAIEWANYIDTKVGSRDEKLSQASARYAALAKAWKSAHGVATSGVSTAFVTRVDGYSDDVTSGEV